LVFGDTAAAFLSWGDALCGAVLVLTDFSAVVTTLAGNPTRPGHNLDTI
jgi:hypothetical protein